MATKIWKFRGKINWAKTLFIPDEYNGVKNYKATLYDLDDESLNNMKESGIRVKFRKNPKTGIEEVSFKRPPNKEINGQMVEFGRPAVSMFDGSDVEEIIGHGSTVEVEVSVYDTRMGKGHRLNSVTVVELVPVPTADESVSAKKAFVE